MNDLVVSDLPFSNLKLITRNLIGDNRGFLTRLFCSEDLRRVGWDKPIAQINYTYTAKKGAIRGLHYQKVPFVDMKLVTCIKGEILDIVVDLRTKSETYLHYCSIKLTEANNQSLLIPEGFAHGFQALTNNVELIYCHSASYQKEYEAGLNMQDPTLKIQLPIDISEVSQKDLEQPFINKDFEGFVS